MTRVNSHKNKMRRVHARHFDPEDPPRHTANEGWSLHAEDGRTYGVGWRD